MSYRIKSYEMKHILLLSFLLAIFFNSHSQNRVEINIACGIAGYTSPEVHYLIKINNLKDYTTLRKKLINGTDIEKIIIIVMLEDHQLNKRITLTNNESEIIKSIKKSRKEYSLCYTCTEHFEGTISDFFTRGNSNKKLLFSPYETLRRFILN